MKSDQSSRCRDPAFTGKEAFGISMEENCLYKAGHREREGESFGELLEAA